MAAVTPIVPASGGERAKPFAGMRHEVYPMAGSVTSGDTWTTNTKGIVRIATGSLSSGVAYITRAVVTNETTITFNGTAGGTAFFLHIWRK